MTLAAFEQLVEDALGGIPAAYRSRMRNVVLVVEDHPPEPGLLGLYEGRPLTERGVNDGFTMPDRITIYRMPHERMARNSQHLVASFWRAATSPPRGRAPPCEPGLHARFKPHDCSHHGPCDGSFASPNVSGTAGTAPMLRRSTSLSCSASPMSSTNRAARSRVPTSDLR